MHEALCRLSGTTLDSVHAEDGPPITQRTSGLRLRRPRAGVLLPLSWTPKTRQLVKVEPCP